MTDLRDILISRLTATLLELRSPDGMHRALRSQYSRRGVCETYRDGQHSPLCAEYWQLLNDVADWHDTAAPVTVEREVQQANLFSEASG